MFKLHFLNMLIYSIFNTVCERFLGLANFANTIPAIHDDMTTPRTLCMLIKITASGHSSVVWREPYLKWILYQLNCFAIIDDELIIT